MRQAMHGGYRQRRTLAGFHAHDGTIQLRCSRGGKGSSDPMVASERRNGWKPAGSPRANPFDQYGRRRSTHTRATAPHSRDPRKRIADSIATIGQYMLPWNPNGTP